tara:strand:- start:3103 stop:3537 length:435 start_codon:yes stop_codon:yes gene_type:complete
MQNARNKKEKGYSSRLLEDSAETAYSMRLFKTKRKAMHAHKNFTRKRLSMSGKIMKNLMNFNRKVRYKSTAKRAYPMNDRPRGEDDIKSVKYFLKTLKSKKSIPPISILKRRTKHILLDGAHRIVATYIAKRKTIDAIIILDEI